MVLLIIISADHNNVYNAAIIICHAPLRACLQPTMLMMPAYRYMYAGLFNTIC